MLASKIMRVLLLAACAIAVSGSFASAGQRLTSASHAISIGSDRGGYVMSYGLRMMRWRQSGTKVRFSGSCQSACTLYLGLSSGQTCISPGASFGFHSPFGASPRSNRMAQAFMMRNYPGWVKSWLRSQGGLSRGLKTMSYGYASRFIKPCGQAVARRGSVKARHPMDG